MRMDSRSSFLWMSLNRSTDRQRESSLFFPVYLDARRGDALDDCTHCRIEFGSIWRDSGGERAREGEYFFSLRSRKKWKRTLYFLFFRSPCNNSTTTGDDAPPANLAPRIRNASAALFFFLWGTNEASSFSIFVFVLVSFFGFFIYLFIYLFIF